MKEARFKLKDGVTLKKWERPKAIIVPPQPRPGSKQLTCIRHDHYGQYFVDEFTERTSCPTKEDRRNMNFIACPILDFSVALVVCPHYCSAPCNAHMDALKRKGWYTNNEAAPYADRMGRRGKSVSFEE